ncbi:MAG TPA: hypothetical protein VII06_09545 [Chloroflexota bacterium]|jgi:hypothetical protein
MRDDAAPPPPVYISHWTHDGAELWQVQERGGPVCAETDKLGALRAYDARWRRGLHWDPDARQMVSDIPEICSAIWNGDTGAWDDPS